MTVVLALFSSAASGYLGWLAEDGSLLWCGMAAGMGLTLALQWRTIGSLASVAGGSVWVCVRLKSRCTGRLVHCKPENTRDPVMKERAVVIQNILGLCPELINPRYIPTFWAADTWTNCALFIMKQLYDKSCLRRNNYTRELLTLDDGGTVSIDYLECSSLPATAPFCIFLHTITGSAKETGHFMRYASRRGWRSCVFNRRGHAGVPLTSPSFNVMGEAMDTKAQVEAVLRRYPHLSYLAMVGISAGSGLLVTYLGKEGDNTPVKAAAALCPAYDITRAFSRLSLNFPIVDSHILASMKRLFLWPNAEILSNKSTSAFHDCCSATTIHEFLLAHFKFAGCESVEEYFAQNNPMEWVGKVARPTFIVNSEDDMVCLAENIREDIVGSLPGAILLRTPRGSHIAFNEGLFGTGNYLSRVTMDFLDAARTVDQRQQ